MTKTTWANKAIMVIDKWQHLLELFAKYPTLREVCPSSDSGKQSIECWCAECKELVADLSMWSSVQAKTN